MSTIKEQVDSFHQFASNRINNGGADLSFEELIVEWEFANDREGSNKAIRQGIADVDAGRVQLADEAMEEIRKEFNLPE